jgi:hemerythrin-like domain-containing protein/uncharacterized protein (DUF2249 family)
MENQTVTLDIRPVPVREKHPTIFRTFDGMAPGSTLLLINDHDPKPLYYQFAAERAGEFQWKYIEQGPEVWKVEIHKERNAHASLHEPPSHEHHHFDKATEALKHEHRVIEKVLASLEKLAEPSREVSIEPWRNVLEFIRGFADQCHHHKEERLLFPALEKQGIPLEGGPIGVMLAEHEEGRGYVRAMVDALANAEKDPKAAKDMLAQNAGSYLRLLREHIQKEEEVLFNIADETLSPDEQKQLVREFEEHEEKEIGLGVHEKYLRIAHELEKQ